MPRIRQNAKSYAMKDIGNLIAYRRRCMGMTQADLAEKLGVTQQTVSHMEKNAGSISQLQMFEIINVLDFDIDTFLKAYGIKLPKIRAFIRENQ